jgi:pimeloyl-ACP methyl ester carboxylesterase
MENDKKVNLYVFPGQGADARLFTHLNLPKNYSVHPISYPRPEKGTTMTGYAKLLSQQIDTSEDFMLLGVSLGGMLATELAELLNPRKIIVVSSAKSKFELPIRYRFQNKLPLYAAFSPQIIKQGAKMLQPLVEPDRKKEAQIFISMLNDKDPVFMKRTIEMIVNWDRETYDKRIIHIHGDSDHTIPIRNVQYAYKIEGGSHMMMLTKGEELSEIITQILSYP